MLYIDGLNQSKCETGFAIDEAGALKFTPATNGEASAILLIFTADAEEGADVTGGSAKTVTLLPNVIVPLTVPVPF